MFGTTFPHSLLPPKRKLWQFLPENYSMAFWRMSVWEIDCCCLSFRSVLRIIVTTAVRARNFAEYKGHQVP